ncbi:T9SS type A sorting domain-containing protein [Salibacter halophilus]|uniref:T9SS type A sorting domain-containing protein n=1 Tax=Salibacter halophilus TaxID=1803916 RepID=A0A6N6M519_9FLAO|nr:T9SS type A sorting domain-containing protein [Salibacter halophilus]KAB1064699.1 T9SS type A sorting domain-containing protein [Salibacter halophilus]
MRSILLAFVTVLLTFSLQAQNSIQKQSMVCLLDMTHLNNNNDSRLFACKQILIATGASFVVRKSIGDASQYGAILFSSDILNGTFNSSQRDSITNYVSNGGVVITSNVKDPDFYDLFGISDYTSTQNNYFLNWDTDSNPDLFTYFDDPLEKEIQLGRTDYPEVIYSRHYDLDGATPLAYFENDQSKPAVIRHEYGQGKLYAFGLSLRDVSLRCMLNYDYNAERTFSNGFEPGADVFPLFIRSILAKEIDNFVWKHTSPANSYNTVMVTHDVDSRTGMDTMKYFAMEELKRGIRANYNITTRYFADSAMSDFYVENHPEVQQLLSYNQIISSHSVGHFYDFHEFPLGPSGLTPFNYTPFYDGNSTNNGYVMPEVEVSKNILEANHGVSIKTFRSGHLRFPDKLANALEAQNYQFESSLSTNDLMYSFPFPLKENRSFSGRTTSVYEISMTLSDVYNANGFESYNYHEGVTDWVKATKQYEYNYSPVTLLIHPNRIWKVDAMKLYLDYLSEKNMILDMETYGNFWKKREQLRFWSEPQGDGTTVITIPDDQFPLDPFLSFGVHGTENNGKVIVKRESGQVLDFTSENVHPRNHILVYQPTFAVGNEIVKKESDEINFYPNPASPGGQITIDKAFDSGIELSMYNLSGQLVYSKPFYAGSMVRTSLPADLNPGVYVISISGSDRNYTKKVLITH